ncbi:MAG TPA: tetratricopeptide repeat protein, partial [Terriglobales bacterium]|nr:tetratricopeptide repeat protein [Terriglobales bacterium]
MANSAQNRNSTNWTPMQAYVLAAICLVVGIFAGYFIHGSALPAAAAPETQASGQAAIPSGMTSGQMAPGQLQAIPQQQSAEMVAAAAKPLLDELAADPSNVEKTTRVGDFYFDSHVYDKAISYYEASLKLNPGNPSVLTDLGTAYFYSGDSNTAIKKFDQALKTNPNFANALFNLGIVRWQGLKDPKGAIDAWEKLLQTNPNYEQKDHVRELMERAKAHGS